MPFISGVPEYSVVFVSENLPSFLSDRSFRALGQGCASIFHFLLAKHCYFALLCVCVRGGGV